MNTNKKFQYTNNIKNKEIYIFVICNELKKNIDRIKKLLSIKSIPKQLFDVNDINVDTNKNTNKSTTTNTIKHDFERRLYTDSSEVIFYGVSKDKKCDHEHLYDLFGRIGKSISNIDNKKILIDIVSDDTNIIKNQIISLILGYYNFVDLKTEKTDNKSKIFFYHSKKKVKSIIESSIYEASIQNEIRSLINTPANILASTVYSKYIKNNMNKNVKIKILNEKDLKKCGCNLILGVNEGSKNKPMMVILEYKNAPSKIKPVAIIGKGVMFDSGGYNIKMGDFSDMKNDMTGSAIVFGLFKLLSHFEVKGNFVGLLPLVENMVDANSIRPGDILKAYNGKTVEIIDTDAEGRLIMADALSYSEKYKPKLCIDIATLTGQAVAIFDSKASVIMGNTNKYIQEMIKCGKENNEKMWELPMWQEYVDLTRSHIADFRNYTYESKAGTIMAGAFLSNFIPKNTDWIHLDIAGVDNLRNNTSSRHYGATGEILRSVFTFLQSKSLH